MKKLSFNHLKRLVRESILEDNEIEAPTTDVATAPAPTADDVVDAVDDNDVGGNNTAIVDLVKQLAAACGLTVSDAEEDKGDEPAEEPAAPTTVSERRRRMRRLQEARRRVREARARRLDRTAALRQRIRESRIRKLRRER